MKVTNKLVDHTCALYRSGDPYYTGFSFRTISQAEGQFKSINEWAHIGDLPKGPFVPGRLKLSNVEIKTGVAVLTPGRIAKVFYHAGFGYTYDYVLRGCFPLLASMWGGSVGSLQPYGVWDLELARNTLIRAHAQVNAAQLETGVMLGELKETLDMLRHPLRDLVNNLGHFCSQKVWGKNRAKALSQLGSSEWLRARYGILPAVKDLVTIQNLFYVRAKRQANLLKRRRSFVHELEQTDVGNYSNIPVDTGFSGSLGVICTGLQLRTRRVRTCHSSVYFQYLSELDRVQDLLFEFGMHPRQLLSIAWELVPLSFIVDRFCNIGPWLQAISPHPSLLLLGNSTSQKTVHSIDIEMIGVPTVAGVPIDEWTNATYSWNSETLLRRVQDPLPEIPVWQGLWQPYQSSIDVLTLILQRARGQFYR